MQDLGYIKTYEGEFFNEEAFAKEIRRIHKDDPTARFVLLGDGKGARNARDLAAVVGRDHIPIDLLVALNGGKMDNRSRPENVLQVVNIQGKNASGEGAQIASAVNLSIPEARGFGLATQPETIHAVLQELLMVASRVPVIDKSPAISQYKEPTPRPMKPVPPGPRDEWDFLLPEAQSAVQAGDCPTREACPGVTTPWRRACHEPAFAERLMCPSRLPGAGSYNATGSTRSAHQGDATMKKWTLTLLAVSAIAGTAMLTRAFTLAEEKKAAKAFERQTIDLGVVVSNVDKAVSFYKEAIGFEELKGFSVPGDFCADAGLTSGKPLDIRVLALGDSESATKLKLMTVADVSTKKTDNDYIHSQYGFRYITIFVTDMNAAMARLDKAGIKPLGKSPVALPKGFPEGVFLTCVRDPDGNIVELVGPKK